MTALFLIFIGYAAGYIVGRLDIIYSALRCLVTLAKTAADTEVNSRPVMKSTAQSRKFSALSEPDAAVPRARVNIDEAKFVAPVSTAGMERAGAGELGKTTAVQDDIGASVSKLSQLKGK